MKSPETFSSVERIKELEMENLELHEQLQHASLQYAHHNEFLKRLSKKMDLLLQVFPGEESDCRHELLHIKNLVKQQVNKQIWAEFQIRFSQVHAGFYDRLLKRYPNLTTTDLKLCALIRIKMSTKEIARVINRKADSVKVSRSRLRKKLGLTRSPEPLLNFIARQ